MSAAAENPPPKERKKEKRQSNSDKTSCLGAFRLQRIGPDRTGVVEAQLLCSRGPDLVLLEPPPQKAVEAEDCTLHASSSEHSCCRPPAGWDGGQWAGTACHVAERTTRSPADIFVRWLPPATRTDGTRRTHPRAGGGKSYLHSVGELSGVDVSQSVDQSVGQSARLCRAYMAVAVG